MSILIELLVLELHLLVLSASWKILNAKVEANYVAIRALVDVQPEEQSIGGYHSWSRVILRVVLSIRSSQTRNCLHQAPVECRHD